MKKVGYYESIKEDLKIKPISECRCDERLKTKTEESTHLTYTGLKRCLLRINKTRAKEKYLDYSGNWNT